MLAPVMSVAMALLGLGQHAFAGCTCSIPGGECGRGWSSGQVIFLGKVAADIATEAPVVEDSEETSAEVLFPGAVQNLNLPMNHEVYFSIAESFRGEGQLGHDGRTWSASADRFGGLLKRCGAILGSEAAIRPTNI